MGKILEFKGKNQAKDPDVVLSEADGQYSSVLIIGWSKEDKLDARASLDLTTNEILWLIENFKHKLLNGDYRE
jgi:hypothetical protein